MHEITLLQGLSLAALVFVLGIDFWLEALFLFRPIIVCTLTGAILGDIQTGLIPSSRSCSTVNCGCRSCSALAVNV
ncbi:PTS sugar transporter subunit IIC, partial [Escherichia coli]